MKEPTPEQRALHKYRTAIAEMVVAKQRETAAALACDRATEDYKIALTKASDAQDVADRARLELEKLLAPVDPTTDPPVHVG